MVLTMLVIAWALGIALADILSRRIPNIFSVGAIFCGLAYLAYAGQAILGGGWFEVMAGMLIALLLTLPAYLMRWLGAGDVKLLLAIAALGGWKVVLTSFAVAGILGSVSTVAVLQYATYFGQGPTSKRWLPFGAMLAMGLIASMQFKW